MKDGAPIVKFGAYSDRTTVVEQNADAQVALLQHKNERGEVVQLIGVVSRKVGENRETVVFRFDPKSGDPKDVVGEGGLRRLMEKKNREKRPKQG